MSLKREGDRAAGRAKEFVSPRVEPEGRRARRLWLALLLCGLVALALTAVFGYLALGPTTR